MLSSEAQQSLPQDAQVALQQVDNRKQPINWSRLHELMLTTVSEILFNISSCRLDAGPIYPAISFTYWRIRFLRAMVR